MRVLITRPKLFAQSLCQKLERLNIDVELFPTIALKPSLHVAELQAGIDALSTADLAIFVSRAAIHFALPHLPTRLTHCPHLRWAAVGPGTAHALQAAGLKNVIFPTTPPYGSEALLAMPVLNTITDKTIVIFQGNEGQPWLIDTLQQRGATVRAVETYQLNLPKLRPNQILPWEPAPLGAIVTTSQKGLQNLLQLAGQTAPLLKAIPLVVISKSMHELANKLEFKYPLLAMGADDQAIITVLLSLQG